jgi:hypothetical protein
MLLCYCYAPAVRMFLCYTDRKSLINNGAGESAVARCAMAGQRGIEPSFRRIPFYSSANLCFTREKLALLGFVSYIELHSNEWQKRNY